MLKFYTFAIRRSTCPEITINGEAIPSNKESVKYLGLQLDRKLTWQRNTLRTRKKNEKSIKCRRLRSLFARSVAVILENKPLSHKAVLKPISGRHTTFKYVVFSILHLNLDIFDR